MAVLKRIDKPEYFFRPKQLLLRLARFRNSGVEQREVIETPWGLPLGADVHENIGKSLWHLGVYDLMVSEALWRLADPGEHHLDIGANLGYMTSLLALRAGKDGKVTSYEPHPAVFADLEQNVARWKSFDGLATPKLVRAAVSQTAGTGKLCIPSDFRNNQGLSFLKGTVGQAVTSDEIEVDIVTLDDQFADIERIGVMKVDVEGNEVEVFAGARRLMEALKIRDIIFEDHGVYPTPAMASLEKYGYIIYRLRKTFFGPQLNSCAHKIEKGLWEPTSYIATLDPVRLVARMRRRGWRVLTNPRS